MTVACYCDLVLDMLKLSYCYTIPEEVSNSHFITQLQGYREKLITI
jgi:hypothetical protein